MVELYFHFPIRFHGVEFDQLNTGQLYLNVFWGIRPCSLTKLHGVTTVKTLICVAIRHNLKSNIRVYVFERKLSFCK
jgi:hypothetical protein